ncbi:MAG: family hydrolase [Herminiimonas sp.]|jgi:D-glycero-D-manno-heptose 1,7-bisphosphate phosphatase|nr:family hydrolase [Herminiimonas sp.]
MRAIFLDKDGTLVEDVPYNVDPGLVRLSPGAGDALRSFRRQGYALFVITNQTGIAKGFFSESALQPMQRRLSELLLKEGTALDGFYYCPHHPDGNVGRYTRQCVCRKPMPGLILRAACRHRIDLPQSWMIGDILDDVEAGRRAGCKTVLINNGNETEWALSGLRMPDLIAPGLSDAADIIEFIDRMPAFPFHQTTGTNHS